MGGGHSPTVTVPTSVGHSPTRPSIAECVQQGLQLVSEGPGLGFPDACVLIAIVELRACVLLTLTYPSPGLELEARALSMSRRRAPSAVLCTRFTCFCRDSCHVFSLPVHLCLCAPQTHKVASMGLAGLPAEKEVPTVLTTSSDFSHCSRNLWNH